MAVRSSTSVGGAFDPKKYTGPVTKVSADEFHKKLMSFGPEGPPLDWDPRGLEVDESSIGPRKTMRHTGFPAEDSPMAMKPKTFEPAPEPDHRRDSYTGKMIEMPGLRAGDGRRWSRGKLLPSTPSKGIVGLDGVTRTLDELEKLRSLRDTIKKEHAGGVRDVRGGMVLGPYSDRFE